jgi:hypothetical protein
MACFLINSGHQCTAAGDGIERSIGNLLGLLDLSHIFLSLGLELRPNSFWHSESHRVIHFVGSSLLGFSHPIFNLESFGQNSIDMLISLTTSELFLGKTRFLRAS